MIKQCVFSMSFVAFVFICLQGPVLGKVIKDSPLTVAEIRGKKEHEISKLEIAQLQNFQIKALRNSQIKSLTNKQLNDLSSSQIKAMRPDQIASLSLGQVRCISEKLIEYMTDFQRKALSSKQKIELGLELDPAKHRKSSR